MGHTTCQKLFLVDVLRRVAPVDPYMFAVNFSGGMYWDD